MRGLWSRAAPLLSGKAVAGALSLAYLAIAARTLGPHDYGVLVLLHAYVMTVDAVMNLQGWQVVVRHGGVGGSEASRIMGPLARLEGLAGGAAVAVAALLAPMVGMALGWPAQVIALAGPYSLAVLANARSIPGGYLQAAGRFDLLGAHHALSPTVRLVGATIAALAGWGLIGFIAAWLAAALTEWLSMWIAAFVVLRRRDGAIRLPGSIRDLFDRHPGLGREMVACKADAAYVQLAPQILPLMVGAILGPAAAGVYVIGARACQLIAQPAQLIAQAAFSEFVGRGAPHGGASSAGGLLRTAGPVVALSLGGALLLALPLLFYPGAVTSALGGAAFAAAGPLLVWLALSRLVLAVGPTLSAALVANGRADLSVAANLGSTLALLPMLPPLLSAMGPLGAGPYALAQAVVSVASLLLMARSLGVGKAAIDERPRRV